MARYANAASMDPERRPRIVCLEHDAEHGGASRRFLGDVMLIALLAVLSLGALICAARLVQAMLAGRAWPRIEAVVVGAITNFFDTLGIGSFAPTMAWLKLRNLVADPLIPCT